MAEDPDAIDLAALGLHLRKASEGTPEREAYLEELRKKVKAGEYHVDAEALARKLLENAEADNARQDSGRDDDDHSDELAK